MIVSPNPIESAGYHGARGLEVLRDATVRDLPAYEDLPPDIAALCEFCGEPIDVGTSYEVCVDGSAYDSDECHAAHHLGARCPNRVTS